MDECKPLVRGAPIAGVFPLTVVSGTPKSFAVIGPKIVLVAAGVTSWTRLRQGLTLVHVRATPGHIHELCWVVRWTEELKLS